MMSIWHRCVFMMAFVAIAPLVAQAQLLYQETFETDGEAEGRYVVEDGGFEFTTAGPGIWGRSVDAEEIGLVQNAPARRAAITWGHTPFEDDFTAESLEVWSSLVDWAVDGKTDARIGFYPSYEFNDGTNILAELFTSGGYSVEEVDSADLPDPADIDLVIISSETAPDPEIAFTAYEVPVISFHGPNLDDTAIMGIGQANVEFFDPAALEVVPENQDHPALGGKTGSIPWTANEFVQLTTLGKTQPGGKVLATVEDPNTGDEIPALFVVEEGEALLGTFNPDPEGDVYFVGAALNKFGGTFDRWLDIGPIDVSGQEELKLVVALAATDADFEQADYLEIFVDPDNSGNFASLARYEGNANAELEEINSGFTLSPLEFQDVTLDLPAGATNMVLRFQALNTWGNEIVAIDNVRVFSGDPVAVIPGDFNQNGLLDTEDLDLLAGGMVANDSAFDLDNDGDADLDDRHVWVRELRKTWYGDANLDGSFGTNDLVTVFQAGKFEKDELATWVQGDWNGDQRFGTGDLVLAFQDGGFEQGPKGAVSAVPEPGSLVLLLLGLAGLVGLGRSSCQEYRSLTV